MKIQIRELCLLITMCSAILNACAPAPGATAATSAPSTAKGTPAPTAIAVSAIALEDSVLVAKQLDRSETQWLMPVDPATGNLTAGYDPIELGVNFNHGLAPDGKTLVVASYPAGFLTKPALRFIDLRTWQEAAALELPTRAWASAMAFNQGVSRLAVATADKGKSQVWLVDMDRREMLTHIDLDGQVVDLRFTPDDEGIMLYVRQENYETGVTKGAPIAELLSAADLAAVWTTTLDDVHDGFQPFEQGKGAAHQPGTGTTFRPALVFSPTASSMYVLHADADRITHVDFSTKLTETRLIQPAVSLLDRLIALGVRTAHAKVQNGIERDAAISPDGEIVYTAGIHNELKELSKDNWELIQKHLPLRAIHLSDWAELYASEATGDTLELSPDGATILLAHWEASTGESAGTTLVNAQTGAVLDEVNGHQLRPTACMGGRPLFIASSFTGLGRGTSTFTAFDLDLDRLGTWQSPGYSDWIRLP